MLKFPAIVLMGAAVLSTSGHALAAGDQHGRTIACVGDVVGDGVDGWAISAPYGDNPGVNQGRVVIEHPAFGIRVIDGNTAGAGPGDRFGWSVAGSQGRIVIGSPYASGILATGAVIDAKYNYAPASSEIAAKVRRIEAVCGRHGVPLAAAALQFPLGHPSVAAVIPGAVSAAQVETNVRTMGVAVPAALWDALKAEGLLHAAAPTP